MRKRLVLAEKLSPLLDLFLPTEEIVCASDHPMVGRNFGGRKAAGRPRIDLHLREVFDTPLLHRGLPLWIFLHNLDGPEKVHQTERGLTLFLNVELHDFIAIDNARSFRGPRP